MNRDQAKQGEPFGGAGRLSASWVIREKASKRVICETFDKRVVARLNTAKYEAVPILDHLAEFNANARSQH